MMWKAKSAIIMLMAAVHVAGALKCEADHDCLQDQYCYGEANRTRTCSPCISCAFYKRTVLAKPTCAHSALDCGDCLPGFQEEPLTASKRHYCMPAILPETTATSPHAHVSGAAPSSYLVGSIISVFGVLFCVTSFLWFRGKKVSTTPNARQDVESAVCHHQPPPYEQTGNLIPLLETVEVRSSPTPAFSKENESNESSYSLQVEGRSEQSLAKANPFKRAREPYHDTNNYNNSDQESSSSGLSDTENYPLPNAPDLNDEETMPSTWTPYQDVNDELQPTTNNAVVVEDFNDSGVSMPSSHTTSTGSLADPLRLPDERTRFLFTGFSFSGCIEPPTEEVSASKQQQSSGSPSAIKRARRNSSPVQSTDSNEACRPDSPLDRVMDPATEDRTHLQPSTSSSCTSHNTTLPNSTRLVTGQGTLVFSFSFTGIEDAARSNNEHTTQRVSTDIHHNSSDNGSLSMRVGPNMSSTDDIEEDFVDNSSPSHIPPDTVIV